jgi:hypothetical protein
VLLEELNVIFVELLGHHALIIAHIAINMNSNKNKKMLKKQEKRTNE